MQNEKGQALLIVTVILMCVTTISMAAAGLAAQSAANELRAWRFIQARCAADSGMELAKEKLVTYPMWRNGADIEGPLDPSEPGVVIKTVTVTQLGSTPNPDGSTTETVKVDVIGACGNVTREVQATFSIVYYPQHWQ
ncbi:hypothetical protein GFC01_02000 [Desulfofundulus thermobenzoicus]|uniref:Type 4 fimbrial biogenesis protein PilX N-terminal domain-containing protein n=1 Tax=Desulfofundulus thermobenzoicus TaxID=29376 RepID=A0A6N7IM81_9FIRM|nr:hypothetical protein [Desulfofundulus thermobenzoicus]MQL51061.1 hypothetical protein [Desulfofundulus thermobenzoicus]